MKTANLPSPSERLEHYRLAIEALSENEGYDAYGLCIVLGDIVYGDFAKYAPWSYFKELQTYYPELTKPYTYFFLFPNLVGLSKVREAIQERIDILKNAIKYLANYLNH